MLWAARMIAGFGGKSSEDFCRAKTRAHRNTQSSSRSSARFSIRGGNLDQVGQFFLRGSRLNQLFAQFPSFAQVFHLSRHQQRRGGIQQHRVAFGPAFFAGKNSTDNFRVCFAVAASEMLQRCRLQREIFRGNGRATETAFLIKLRQKRFAQCGELIEEQRGMWNAERGIFRSPAFGVRCWMLNVRCFRSR